MKKVIFAALMSVLFSATSIASELPSGAESTGTVQNSSSYSPQVCQFSLTSYSGEITYGGNTNNFQVGLSCPQQTDVRATVVVYIDGDLVASKVVTVPAGKDYSSSTYISVGSSYSGKRYELGVQ